MKTAIKRNWLVIVLMALVVACTAFGIHTMSSGKSAQVNTVEAATVVTTDPAAGATELTKVGDCSATRFFYMDRGASMRIKNTDSGIRFTAYYGAELETAIKKAYPDATTKLYMQFTRTENGKSAWVETSLTSGGAYGAKVKYHYTISASFAYNGLNAAQFETAIAAEMYGRAIIVITDGENKYVINAVEDDNVRSAQAVVNAAIMAGEEQFYPNLNRLGFVKSAETLTSETVFVESDGNRNVEVPNLTTGITAVYHGAKKLSATSNGTTITLNNLKEEGYNGDKGKDMYLSVVDANRKFWRVPATFVDKAIRTAQDFEYFNVETETTLFDGYYVLANDITVKEDIEMTHHGLHEAKQANNLTGTISYEYAYAGFGGTFDGRGHKATFNIKTKLGLFGQLQNGAVIKDVAFYEIGFIQYDDNINVNANGEVVTGLSAKGDNGGLLFYGIRNGGNATLSNTFIQVNSASIGVNHWGTFGVAAVKLTLEGVLIEFNPAITNLKGAIYGYQVSSASYGKGIIAVTTQNLARNGAKRWVGCNEGYTNNQVVGDITYQVVDNFYRYADYEKLANDYDNLKDAGVYDNFSTDFWSFGAGVPAFNGFEYLEMETLDHELRYSTYTDEIFVENDALAISTISSIKKIHTNEVYYTNGACTEFIPKNYTSESLDEITYNVIVELTNGKQYYAKLVSYTMVINEDTDFVVFNESNHKTQCVEGHAYSSSYTSFAGSNTAGNPATGYKMHGYFILNNDITLSGNWNGNNHEYNNTLYVFGGTFDGDGHVVELRLYAGGLFGALSGATVKDTAFVAKELHLTTAASGRYSILADKTTAGTDDHTIISNVYAKYELSDAVISRFNSWGRPSGLSLISHCAYYLDYNNVIFDASDLVISDIDAGLGYFGFVHAFTSTTYERDGCRGQVTNNYFITSIPYVVHVPKSANYVVTEGISFAGYGANQTDAYNADTTSASKYQYKGIKLYSSVGDLAADKENNTAWNATFDQNVWDTTGDYPVFKGFKNQQTSTAVKEGVVFTIDGQSGDDYDLTDTASVVATYNGNPYVPTLTVVDGLELISISENVITANANKYGTVTLVATANVEGVFVSKEFTFTVRAEKLADITANTVLTVGGKAQTSIDLYNSTNNSVDVVATYGGANYDVTLAVISGADCVTVLDNTITVVKDALGTATIRATYVVEGAEFTKDITVNVSYEKLEGNIKYSTNGGGIFLPEKAQGKEIVTIIDADNDTVYYENGAVTANVPANTNSTDLTAYTKRVYVTFSDAIYETTLVSYTKVISTAKDLECFDILADTPTFTGYYIVANNIVGTEPVVISRAGSTDESTVTNTGFNGVFDGDGHYISITLSQSKNGNWRSGLLSILGAKAVVKNVAFVDCSFNSGYFLFGYSISGAQVQDVYLDITATGSGTYGGGAFGKPELAKLTGVFVECYTSPAYISGGRTPEEILAGNAAKAGNHGHGTFASNDWTQNASRKLGVIVVSEAPMSYSATKETNHIIAVGMNEGYTTGDVIDCTCAEGSTVTVKVYNVYHYATISKLAEKKSEIASVLSNYSSTYWDTTLGYPRFRSVIEKEKVDSIEKDTVITIGDEVASTYELSNVAGSNTVSTVATYNSVDYKASLEILTGAEFITVLDNVITANVNKYGTATVRATYDVEGVTLTKEFTINVGLTRLADINANTTFAIGGEALENYDLSNVSGSNTASVVATYGGNTYNATLQILTGAEYITVLDNVITANVNVYGSATVMATFDVEGVAFEKEIALTTGAERKADILENTVITLGNGTETTVKLLNKADSSISTVATYNETEYEATLAILTGEGLVVIDGNTITAVVNAYGPATVNATYLVEGVEFTAEFTINVSFEKLDVNYMYSTQDNQLFAPYQLDGKEIDKIIDAEDSTVYYENDAVTANVIKNNDSSDLTDYTRPVFVLLDGEGYEVTLTSYTRVIDEDTDLACLVDVPTSSENHNFHGGYYILANNIERSGNFKGNKGSASFTIPAPTEENPNKTTNVTRYSYFNGTLDGNGYYIDLQLNSGGLICAWANGAVVKDLAIYINNKATTTNDYIFASTSYNMWGGNSYTVSNVYVEINVKFGNGAAKILEEGCSSGARINNLVVKLADGVQGMAETGYTRGGVFYGYTNGLYVSQTDGFNYVNSTAASDPKNNNNYKNSYFISSDYKFVSRWIENSEKRNCVVAENDAELYSLVTKSIEEGGYGYKQAGYISGIKRYDNLTDMAAADLDLTSFSEKCWDTTSGAPIWKSKAIEDGFVLNINDEQSADVELTYKGEDSATVEFEYAGKTYDAKLSVVSGAEFVAVNANEVSMASYKEGTATVYAYAFIDGVKVDETFTVTCVIPDETAKTAKFSTLDNEFFLDEYEGKTVAKLTNLEDDAVLYTAEDGATVSETLKNTDSKDLTNYTKNVLVDYTDGTSAKTTFISYTKVLDEDTDLSIFKYTDATVAVSGYYFVNNDISLETWEGNKFGAQPTSYVGFNGVFDGNGHFVEIALYQNGIFGKVGSAQIKDTAFIVKAVNENANDATGSSYVNMATVFGYSMVGSPVLSNLYVKYDLPEGHAINTSFNWYVEVSGVGLFSKAQTSNATFNNIIVDMSTLNLVTSELYGGLPAAYGAITSKISYANQKNDINAEQYVSDKSYLNGNIIILGEEIPVSTEMIPYSGLSVVQGGSGNFVLTSVRGILYPYNKSLSDYSYDYNHWSTQADVGTYGYDDMVDAFASGEQFTTFTSDESGLWTIEGTELRFNGIAIGNSVNLTFTEKIDEVPTTSYKLVVPDNYSKDTQLKNAKEEFHDLFYASTGVDIEVVQASRFTGGNYISIGNTGLASPDAVAFASTLKTDDIYYYSDGENVHFLGKSNYGINYGIYDFFETHLNFDTFFVDADQIDSVDEFKAASFEVYKTPDIEQRYSDSKAFNTNSYLSTGAMDSGLVSASKMRNRLRVHGGYAGYNGAASLYKETEDGSSLLTVNGDVVSEITGMHNTLDYIPYNTYSAEHGAYWYATDSNNNLKTLEGSTQPLDICYTAHGDAAQYDAMVNQYVNQIKRFFYQRELLKSLQEKGKFTWLGTSWNTISISIEDNNTVCSCNACTEAKAKYGGYDTGAVIVFLSNVRDGVLAWFETQEGQPYAIDDFKILFFAYQRLIDAPVVYDDELGTYVPVHEDIKFDGLVAWLAMSGTSKMSFYLDIDDPRNADGKLTVEKWAAVIDDIRLWTYQTNFGQYFQFTDNFAFTTNSAYKFFANNNITSWIDQNAGSVAQTGYTNLKNYMDSKLMWDNDADIDALYTKYFNGMYGNASNQMFANFMLQRELFQQAYEAAVADGGNIYNSNINVAKYYNEESLIDLVEKYELALSLVEEGSNEYYHILIEMIAPYFQLLTCRQRLPLSTSNYSANIPDGYQRITQEILDHKSNFRTRYEQVVAKYGSINCRESSDSVNEGFWSRLGYYYNSTSYYYPLLVFNINGTNTANRYFGTADFTVSDAEQYIGWVWYSHSSPYSSFSFDNLTIEITSGAELVELKPLQDKEGNDITTIVKADYNHRKFGTIKFKEAGTVALKMTYYLDGQQHISYLTINITNPNA